MTQNIKLKLGGKEREFTFGIIFLGELLERLEMDYAEMFGIVGKGLFKYAPILMFESLKNTYNIDKKELDFTEKDIIAWLEKEPFSGYHVINNFILAFMESQNNNTPLEEDKETKNTGVKKK